MKILALILVCSTSAFAAGITHQTLLSLPTSYTGIQTNNSIVTTNPPTMANLLMAAPASTTNLTIANIVLTVPAQSAALCVRVIGTNASFTSTVGFMTERSYDRQSWSAFTNFVVTGNGVTAVQTDKELSFGAYPYFRVTAITNANTSSAFARVELISK